MMIAWRITAVLYVIVIVMAVVVGYEHPTAVLPFIGALLIIAGLFLAMTVRILRDDRGV